MLYSNVEIVVVALQQFDSGAVWWIGTYANDNGEEFVQLDDCDSNTEFAEQFNITECIETHSPKEIGTAMKRAKEISRERKAQLYRATCYVDGGDCEVLEAF